MTLSNLFGKASGDVTKPLHENTDATEEARSPKEQELYICQEDISFQPLSICELLPRVLLQTERSFI